MNKKFRSFCEAHKRSCKAGEKKHEDIYTEREKKLHITYKRFFDSSKQSLKLRAIVFSICLRSIFLRLPPSNDFLSDP
ncbi:unnamed protein product [Trifolium pratense]|uniref:Uncharacterized protein n=1 Tax=Trifolium pratense TaxID=57577 RepID=A0ACB0KFU5_TRIPR|nr:unnamed protein product [Trifolium pratense]